MKKILLFILIAFCWYLALATTVGAFKNPSLTQTQLFLRIPRFLILDWGDDE